MMGGNREQKYSSVIASFAVDGSALPHLFCHAANTRSSRISLGRRALYSERSCAFWADMSMRVKWHTSVLTACAIGFLCSFFRKTENKPVLVNQRADASFPVFPQNYGFYVDENTCVLRFLFPRRVHAQCWQKRRVLFYYPQVNRLGGDF